MYIIENFLFCPNPSLYTSATCMYISFYASEIHKLDRLIQTAYTFISTQIKCGKLAFVWKITHVDCL